MGSVKIIKSHLRKIVEVTFQDHAQNSPLIKCTCWGELAFIDDKCIVVRTWRCDDMPDSDGNHEVFTILKVAIESFKVLK